MAINTSRSDMDAENLLPAKRESGENRQGHDGPSQKSALPRKGQKSKQRSRIARMCIWVVDHQIGSSINASTFLLYGLLTWKPDLSATLISFLFLTHFYFPAARHHTQKFFRISYYNAATDRYALGWDDIHFVFYWIIVFTGMRCAVMDYILTPFAKLCGIKKKKLKVRFAEQAWIFAYYTTSWSIGMYIMYHSDHWLNLRALWRNFPTREMEGLFKWYYLVQFAFWIQQIVVVHIEERRKDHWQMLTHHIITCTLIFTSYGYHYFKAGNLILCLMDVVDLFFPLAKMLKYLHYQAACDVCFVLFMVSWFIARHVFFLWMCWSILYHVPVEMPAACWRGGAQNLQGPLPQPDGWAWLIEPFRDPTGLICFNENIRWTFFTLLIALQIVLLGWFYMIMRVAYRVISGQSADDPRSDDEEEEEEGVENETSGQDKALDEKNRLKKHDETKTFIEREVVSTDSNFSSTASHRTRTTDARSPVRSSRRKVDGTSTGVNILAGSSDRKELLGRIGCDKPSGD